MNLFKVQCASQAWELVQQQEKGKCWWTRFNIQQTDDNNSYISDVNYGKQDYFSSNPEVLFQQIMISFRKQYSIDQQVTNISHNDSIRFKLQLSKPQFCMGAFTHNTQPLFNQLNPNIITLSPEQYRPFTSMVQSQYRSMYNNSFSSRYEKGMDQEEELLQQVEFNKILENQSKYFKGGKMVDGKIGGAMLKVQSWNNNNEDKMRKKASNIFNPGQNYLMQQDGNNISTAMIDEWGQSTTAYKDQKQRINENRAFQLGLIQLNQSAISFIKQPQDNCNQQQGGNMQLQYQDKDILSKSIFSHYDQLLTYSPQYNTLPAWQQSVVHPILNNNSTISQFQISHQWHQSKLSLFQSNLSISNDATYIIPEHRLFVLIGEMLVGVENKLFWLDYDKCEWYVDLRGLRFEYVLRESFIDIIHSQLALGNMLSRLRKFIEFAKHRKQRMLYFEISKITESTLQSFQSYVLELTNQQQHHKQQQQRQIHINDNSNNKNNNQTSGLLEFITDLDQLVDEIRILYKLIIWQSEININNMSYLSFTYKFIKPQFQLFQTIMKLTRQSDQLQPKYNHLLRMLFQASFKPILLSLNKILFECINQITPKQEIYLKYYFESIKELLNLTSKRIMLIYKQSPQLYLVSKERLNLSICFDLHNLKSYDQAWSQLFYYKFTSLQRVLNQMIQNQKQDQNQLQKKRKRQLQLLKEKLHERSLKEKTLKQQQKGKKLLQMQRLKKQIKQKQEKNKLQALIQKQRQRGYLLQGQLRNKILLLKQKQRLLQQLPQQLSNNNLIKTTSIVQQMMMITDREQPLKEESQHVAVSSNVLDKTQSNQQIDEKEINLINVKSQSIMIDEITPIVNVNISQVVVGNKGDNKLESSKEYRTRKIKKLPSSNIRHKKLIIKPGGTLITQLSYEQNDVLQPTIQSSKQINFRDLCQKSKQLNFHPLTISMIESQQQSQSLHDHHDSQSSDDAQDNQHNTIEQQYNVGKTSNMINYNTKQQSCTGANAILDICIDKVIQNQMQVVNNCYEIIIFQKYHLKDIIKFMKATFLSENGEKQHNLLSVCCSTKTSRMTLKSFTQCSLLDNLPHFISQLKPQFYHTRQHNHQAVNAKQYNSIIIPSLSLMGIDNYYGQIDIISDNLDQQIGFSFTNIPAILQPYFSYIHLSKYMQIFAFILRIKHCQMIISQSWLTLNQFKQSLFNNKNIIFYDSNNDSHENNMRSFTYDRWQFANKLLNRLFIVRHLIQSFLKTYQNYIFFRVIEKEFKILNKRIDRHEMNQLQASHQKVLDSIIRHAFVDNSTNNITKEIRNLLQLVRQFARIVELLCENNILEEQQEQITNKVKFIHQHFKHNHKFFQALYFKA